MSLPNHSFAGDAFEGICHRASLDAVRGIVINRCLSLEYQSVRSFKRILHILYAIDSLLLSGELIILDWGSDRGDGIVPVLVKLNRSSYLEKIPIDDLPGSSRIVLYVSHNTSNPINSDHIAFIAIHIDRQASIDIPRPDRSDFLGKVRIGDSVSIKIHRTETPVDGFENIFPDKAVHRGGGGVGHPIINLLLAGA